MNRIIFPLEAGSQGPEVADLQAALQVLLDRGAILRDNEGARRELSIGLQSERPEQIYGSTTSTVVRIFQEENRLEPSGNVDEPTANAINAFLQEWGLLDQPEQGQPLVVSGQVRRNDDLPLKGGLVRAFHESERGALRLGEDTTDAEGRYTIRYEPLPEVSSVDLRVEAYDEDGTRLQSSELIRGARPLEIVDLVVPIASRPSEQRRLEGRVVFDNGLPAEQLGLRLYRLDFGGVESRLSETFARELGLYVLPFDLGGDAAGIEVRAVDAAGDETPLSKPMYNLGDEARIVVNLVAPATLQPLAAEYQRLTADLTPHVGEMKALAGARENAERQDLTVLNRTTGWDARLIALAANAEKLSADPEVQLPQEAVYGLLRAGLPSDKLQLAQVNAEVVEQALTKVREAGIVGLSDGQVAEVKSQFGTFADQVRLAVPAPGSRSTYGDLLGNSGLDEGAQKKFASVYLNRTRDADLWKNARDAGLNDSQIQTLQLQGKLAFLAGNSEVMTARLMQRQMADPAQLVEQDFYQAQKWEAEVREVAGVRPDVTIDELSEDEKQLLQALIPPSYTGETVGAGLEAYAEDMARKVRLSYPTQVLGRMVEQDDADELRLGEARPATATLLKNAAAEGFRLGQTPVETFLKANSGVLDGIDNVETAKQNVKTLQRIYQITPSDEAMPVLMELGLTSAYDVVALSQEAFLERFGHKFPSIEEAKLVYRKAQQVSSVTYNLFTIAKKLDSEAPVYGMLAPAEVRESIRNELIKQFPTLESLFGSMDFCECEHCRSVLSPAAYLVDLLQFVDAEPEVWDNFLTHWKETHNNQDYTAEYKKPYDALIERRPDIPHIPLTCENTHTALPYIDIVNEILEYFVAHGKLEEEAAQDTGEATTAELLAEPQNVIRAAYDKLHEARYPLNLPFDLWIETVRRFCNHFETPLERILETFRASDALFAPSQPFDRASVFMESLGLSPTEAAIFTDPDPLSRWHELYGFATAVEATTEATDATTGQRIDLNSAKALSRRLGVTYQEIAEIVQTGFVNPKLVDLRLLYKLGVSIRDARFYLDHKGLLEQDPATLSSEDQQRQLEVDAFSKALEKHTGTFGVTTAQLEAELQAIPFDEILVLADPDAGYNFDLTTLQYADGTKADPITWLRINLFVRLWRKLGWTIEETDRALSTFIPQAVPFDDDPANLAEQPFQTALIYVAHLKALDEKLKVGKQSRLKLLTLWSDIATTGQRPLYAQLFLTRSALRSAPVFDHPLGQYLTDPTIRLEDHVLALQGALGLTADEIGRILADSGKAPDSAELSLANISLLYRYGLLAKALKLSVRDLITLKQLSGVDPFKPLHHGRLATIDEDHPFSDTLRFVEIAEEVKKSSLKIKDLDYLLRHRFDEAGKYRPDHEETLALLKALAEGVRAIRIEHAVPDSPNMLTQEVLRQKLGLVLPPDVVERFLAMMNGTAEFTASQTGVAPANQLAPEGFAGEPAFREVRYNHTRQEQKLTFRGVLFDADKTALKARFPSPILSDLLDDVQRQAESFFEKHLQKQATDIQPAYGFLDAADFALLFDRDLALASGETEQDRLLKQRSRLAKAFLPYLQQRLIHQLVVQTMTAHTDADPALVESLVTDKRLLAVGGAKPLLESFAATGERGVGAAFFDSDDLSGTPQATASVVSSADTALKDIKDVDGNPLNPANSARFEGYLEVPTPGAHRFYIELDKQNSEAELRFDHLPDPVFLQGVAAADNTTLGNRPDEYLELKPGVPYRFSLELKNLVGGGARMLVQSETLPKDDISQLTLYPLSTMADAEDAMLLLAKALQLVQSLGLSEREIRYLLTHAADFGGVNLSQLPTKTVGGTPEERSETTELFIQFLRLAAYARLKRDLAGGTDGLIGIFEATGTGDLNNVYPLIARLTRRDEAMVKTVAEVLTAAPGFESEKPLWRLWEALQIVERFGVPVASMVGWTGIVSMAATSDQRFAIARDLKEAIKARFELESWRRVAQPIFDKLRQRQRDALVAHVMHQHGFARMEQLYEYFLIDPGMEPVVQTSRIRLAISSLQLFIQRCLINLEKDVPPSVINASQWEWMKRYRVWEANRKIFLFPENWLEPEFRDDRTHLFSELEGTLLQGDVSNDLVEDAFLNYLKKLEELARLDVVAMHLEDHPDPALRTLHVIGRTYSEPHKYFYRRYAHQMWTPWEPVTAEIEGDHLAPVVWRDRLYLFWVTFLDKADDNPQRRPTTGTDKLADITLSDMMSDVKAAGTKKQVEVQLHWSEYLQGEWSTRESSGFMPVIGKTWIPPHWVPPRVGDTRPISSNGLVWVEAPEFTAPLTVPLSFDYKSVFIHVSKEPYENGEERGVYINLGSPINQAFYVAGRNSTPEKASYSAAPAMPYSNSGVRATRYSGSGPLQVTFKRRITTEEGEPPVEPTETPSILGQGGGYTLLPCDNDIEIGPPTGGSLDADDPEVVADAIERGLPEIASLMKPLFYQDNAHTLFVEPNVEERTIEEWQEWVTRTPQPEPEWVPWDRLEEFVKPMIPKLELPIPIDPDDPIWRLPPVDRDSRITVKPGQDWLVNPATGLLFEGEVIGPVGKAGMVVLPSTELAGAIAEGSTPVKVHAGSGLVAGSTVVALPGEALDQAGLAQTAGPLNIVGGSGFNSALAQNFDALNGSGFGARNMRGNLLGR